MSETTLMIEVEELKRELDRKNIKIKKLEKMVAKMKMRGNKND